MVAAKLFLLPSVALGAFMSVHLTQNVADVRKSASARVLALTKSGANHAPRPFKASVKSHDSYAELRTSPAPAVGSYNDTLDANGWTNLWIQGDATFGDDQMAYAAGYLESVLTLERTYQGSMLNGGANYTWDPALEAFLINNSQWVHQMTIANQASDSYWYHVWLVLLQLQGLYDGYSDYAQPEQQVPFRTFLNIQLGGDMDDLSAAVGLQAYGRPLPHPRALHRHKQMLTAQAQARAQAQAEAQGLAQGKTPSLRSPSSGSHTSTTGSIDIDEEAIHAAAVQKATRVTVDAQRGLLLPTTDGAGHCSAVIRPLYTPKGDGSGNVTYTDILISQITWSGFEDMVRVYKRISLPFTTHGTGTPTIPSVTSAFSSFGGSIFSGDDWYQLHPSRLVVLETTIGNSNQTLYDLYIRPTTVMDWMRNTVANRLANSGPQWANVFSRYNSGTYNNEFFVLDYKLFTPGSSDLAPDTFWVLDQAPGYISAGDMTASIKASSSGYFGSYNVASFPFIYAISGQEALAQTLGPWFSWNATARANIFRRDAPRVVDEAGFRRLVRYNDFTKDPLSTQACTGNPPYSAENAVAARDDLNPASGNYTIGALGHRDHAAIDAKYATYASMQPGPVEGMVTYAQAGPTYDQQPAFAWSTTSPDIAALSHVGMPDAWTMPWVAIGQGGITEMQGA